MKDCPKCKKLSDTLNWILQFIGNVDHATKTGENDALYRGQKLNDIREVIKEAIN